MGQGGVRFIYVPCDDVARMREFYSNLIGLDEIWFSQVERSVAYDCAGLQFSIFEHREAVLAGKAWAVQPGWAGGTTAATSWSVTLDEAAFAAAVGRLREAGVPARHDEPVWVEYWSYPVRDPMGNTVEVTWSP